MKNVVRKIVSAVTICTIVLSSAFIGVQAEDQPINVFLNGTHLQFEVQPTIINGHTMVPIAQTIQFLTGSAPNWDANTKTMSFTSGNNIVTHTVGTNIVSISGMVKTYDTSSLIMNGRTLVPIRMLADASNCNVEWEAHTKSVIMTSIQTSSYAPQPTYQPAASGQVVYVVDVISQSGDSVVGRDYTVRVVGNENATMAWLYTPSSGEFAKTEQYLLTQDGRREFKCIWTPRTAGTQTITAYVGDNQGDKNFSKFNVNVGGGGAKIDSFTASPTHIQSDETIDVKVVTNKSTECVWYELGDEVGQKNYNYYEHGNGERRFEFSITPSSDTSGTTTLYIYARDNNGNEDSETTRVTIESSYEEAKIYDVSASNTEINVGDTIDVDITVSKNITNVRFVDNDGVSGSADYYSSNNRNTQIFRISGYQPQTAGKKNLTITAINSNGSQVSKRLNINVAGQALGKIDRIEFPTEVDAGTTATMQVHSLNSGGQQGIALSWSSVEQLSYNIGEPDVGAGNIITPVDVYIPAPGTYRITVTLSGPGGGDTKTITITGK